MLTPAVYYWQTTFTATPQAQAGLYGMGVRKIYMRLFDMDWNEAQNKADAVGVISFDTKPDTVFEIAPVVFIRNRVLQHISGSKINDLALTIYSNMHRLAANNSLGTLKEMQIDCDWTQSTAPAYFQLLHVLRDSCHASHIALSATIRLHQVKFSTTTGVPPVDRGMLMFYNMGDALNINTVNSIYDERTAAQYTAAIHKYTLPLDVALPLFDWAIIFRKEHAIGAFNINDWNSFADTTIFAPVGKRKYVVKKNGFFHSKQLAAGDILRVESTGPIVCKMAALQVAKEMATDTISVSLFDFKPEQFFKYDANDIKKIYTVFR